MILPLSTIRLVWQNCVYFKTTSRTKWGERANTRAQEMCMQHDKSLERSHPAKEMRFCWIQNVWLSCTNYQGFHPWNIRHKFDTSFASWIKDCTCLEQHVLRLAVWWRQIRLNKPGFRKWLRSFNHHTSQATLSWRKVSCSKYLPQHDSHL